MTRSFGVLLGPFLFWEYLRQRQYRLKAFNLFEIIASIIRCLDVRVLWFALIPAGLGIFAWVCWQLTGNAFAFIDAADAWAHFADGAKLIDPFSLTVQLVSRIELGSLDSTVRSFGGIFDLLVVAATASVIIIGKRRANISLVVYSFLIISLYVLTNVQMNNSLARYMLPIFPLYMILASYRFTRRSILILVILLGLIQAGTWSLWTNAYEWAV